MDPIDALPHLNALADLTSAATDTVVAATKATVKAPFGSTADVSTPFGSLTKLVMIGLGLLLVAAGIFSFKDGTRETIVSAARAGGALAKGAAAIT